MTTTYFKPLPVLRGLAKEYYGWLKKHELHFQRCTNCGTWRHTPREICPNCGSSEVEWAKSSGKGKVYTWTVTHQPMHPTFVNDVPYAVVTVELEEGPRVITNVIDCPPDELKIGMPVTAVFEDVTDEVTLLKFKRA